MMRSIYLATSLTLVAATSCTKPNPSFCCTTADDCTARGSTEVVPCSDALVCVQNTCVAPECETSSECGAEAPVCEDNECRGCIADAECEAGACGADGSCVEESRIVYLSPTGVDEGACTRTAPCKGLQFAIQATNSDRAHIVMEPGEYRAVEVFVANQFSLAESIEIHGAGSRLVSDGVETLLVIELPTTVKHLELEATLDPISTVIVAGRATRLEDVQITGAAYGVIVDNSTLDASGLTVTTTDPAGIGIDLRVGSDVTLRRATLRGGKHGINGAQGTTVDLENVLVFDAREQGLNLPSTSGIVAFSTVANCGANTPTGARSVACSFMLTIRSSIIWDTGSSPARPPVTSGCTLVSTIAGTAAVPGAANIDPMFVDLANDDYHLAPTSPAIDMVNEGPMVDLDNEPRPSRGRWDIGADEVP